MGKINNNKEDVMKKSSNFSAMLVFAAACLMITIFAVEIFAADGGAKGNPWQTISGILAIITSGAGALIFKNIKIIKELRQAVVATIQVPAAVQLFTKNAPEGLKKISEYVDMMRKIDIATDEVADVLELNAKTAKYAVWLRNVVDQTMYVDKRVAGKNLDTLKKEMKDSEISKSFTKAIAELAGK